MLGHVHVAAESGKEVLVSAPLPHLLDVLDHSPAGLELTDETKHMERRRPAGFVAFACTAGVGVVGAFRGRQDQIDATDGP
jgi:hypothetical protein